MLAPRTAVLLRQDGGEDLAGTTGPSRAGGRTRDGPHRVACVVLVLAAGLGPSSTVTAPFSPFQGPLTAQPTAPI